MGNQNNYFGKYFTTGSVHADIYQVHIHEGKVAAVAFSGLLED